MRMRLMRCDAQQKQWEHQRGRQRALTADVSPATFEAMAKQLTGTAAGKISNDDAGRPVRTSILDQQGIPTTGIETSEQTETMARTGTGEVGSDSETTLTTPN